LANIKPATFQTSVEARFSTEQENPGKRMFSYTFLKERWSACTSVNVFGAQIPQINVFAAFFVFFPRRW